MLLELVADLAFGLEAAAFAAGLAVAVTFGLAAEAIWKSHEKHKFPQRRQDFVWTLCDSMYNVKSSHFQVQDLQEHGKVNQAVIQISG